jgi:hypothetical protein
MPHVIEAKRLFILTHGKDSVLYPQILSCENQINTGMRQRSRRTDAPDSCVRVRRSEQLAKYHSRQRNVVREFGLSSHLGSRVDSPARHTDHA